MEVVDNSKLNKVKIKAFLSEIVEEVDEEVLENASILIDKDKIIGMMSFECFGRTALIRYFVFTKLIDENNLLKLFYHLIDKAKTKNIKRILSFVEKENAIPLFKYLGFFPIDKKYVYIDENNIMETDSEPASIYCYQIT